MSVLRRIARFLLRLDRALPNEFRADPERDANRLRAIVDRERHSGHLALHTDRLWEEMSDGLWADQHRPIGDDTDGIAEREWIYARLQELVEQGRLIEDPEHGGAYGQFWHTSTPVARMINASTEFRVAMELTQLQLYYEGHQELLDVLKEAEKVMNRVKGAAIAYSQAHDVYHSGDTSTHFFHLGLRNTPHCICGWTGTPHDEDEEDEALAQWRRHVPTTRH